MIRLNVFIRTTDSNREEVVNTARELVAASLKDEGCVAYDLFESTTRNDVLMICETWSDAKALAAHEQASHFTTLVPRLHQLGETRKVRLLIRCPCGGKSVRLRRKDRYGTGRLVIPAGLFVFVRMTCPHFRTDSRSPGGTRARP